jgi:cysteinyl-tRNA synthetase
MKILQEINPTNILGIDEHTALIINGEEDSFEVEGLGEVTVINKNVTKKFKIGDKYNLDELKELLKNDVLLKKVKSEPNLSLNEDVEDALKKEIADLRIEIDKNKKNSENVNKLIDKLIEYRLTLRSLQKYEESDVVRDILTDSNIEIEDNKESSSWKFKD